MIDKIVYKVAFFAVIYLIALFLAVTIYNTTRPVDAPFQATYEVSSITGVKANPQNG